MLGLAVFFTVFTGVVVPFVQINAVPAKDIDLESLLKLALSGKNKELNRYSSQKHKDGSQFFGSLKNNEVAELLKKIDDNDGFDDKLQSLSHKKDKKNKKVTFGHYFDPNRDLFYNEGDDYFEKQTNDKIGHNINNRDDEEFRVNNKALEKLLSEKVLDKHSSQSRYKLVPNNLANSDEQEYSKIYVILNPQAIQKSQNKDKLQRLLSNVLSLAQKASKKNYRNKNISSNAELFAKRRRRYSREYSGEVEYKPKRSRHEWSGGGGGFAGGRTAIPYIGHRGDIYERDD